VAGVAARSPRAPKPTVVGSRSYRRGVTDAPATDAPDPTILERLLSSGIDASKAARWIEAGAVRCEGEPVTDPNHPAPRSARWMINPG